jgi:hypothetical protein
MKKQHIFTILILLVIAGVVGAGYQFYFKEQLAKYAENEEFLIGIQAKHVELDNKFQRKKPDEEVAKYNGLVNPWAEAVDRRARVFSIDEYANVPEIPTGELPKPYYIRTSDEMKNRLLVDAYTSNIAIPGVDPYFGRPQPAELAGANVTPENAMKWLREIQFGSSLVRLIIQKGALRVDDFVMWPSRTVDEVFQERTVGIRMWMSMDRFCGLVRDLQYDERTFFNVAGFRITNPYLRWYDPAMQVEVLITMLDYQSPEERAAAASTASEEETTRSPVVTGQTDLQQALDQMRNSRLGSSGEEEE